VSDEPYTFDGLPLEPVPAGSSILVTTADRAGSRLARELVLSGDDRGEGMVLVSTGSSGRQVVADCLSAVPALDTSRLGVVDASGTGDVETDTGAHVESVSNTGDLTGISIGFSVVYSALYDGGVERIRTGFDSVSTLLLYSEFRTITRFVHTMAGRVSQTGGLGVFVLDPAMHEPQVVQTLARLCDGRVDLRRTDAGGYELDAQGPGDQPRGWQPVDL
jgi:microcompartment protein CcmK/EutM